MRVRAIIAAGVLALPIAYAGDAEAACKRLAFLVNDYGKEGPTRDAKSLLDKHIAQWTAERGIKQYTTGPKHVTCELFLDFIVFDEYTCQAEATVCWAGDEPKAASTAAKASPATGNKAAAKTQVPAKVAPVAKPATRAAGEAAKQP